MSDAILYLEIPLNLLTKSDNNVRKRPGSKISFEELKASVRAKGILQNLIVEPQNASGLYPVAAGERRRTVLLSLAAEGVIAGDVPVRCRLLREGEDAEEISLMENVGRESMSPTDEFRAWNSLIERGATTRDVALRFGIPERTVQQRMTLGRLAEEVLNAYDEGDIDLDALKAFTITDDQERQRTVLNQVQRGYMVHASHVKRLLTEDQVSSTSKLGGFVGIEAYETAGGDVARDLFSERDEGFMTDVALVHRLAEVKLQKRAAELALTWKWVEVVPEMDYGVTAQYGRVYPKPTEAAASLEAELDEVRERLEALDNDEAGTEEQEAEWSALEDRYVELEREINAAVEYAADDRARAGCIVTIGRDGDFLVHEGLVKDEDMRADCCDENDEDEGISESLSPEKAMRKANGFSQGLVDDLVCERLLIAKAHLAQDFDAAFDALLFTLARQLFRTGYMETPLDLTARRSREHPSVVKDLSETPAVRLMESLKGDLDLSWLDEPDDQAFATLSSFPPDAKQALFAFCVAQMLEGQLGFFDRANPVVEAIGRRLAPPMREFWRPTEEDYWSRVKKSHALDVGEELLGLKWREEHERAKKSDIARALGAVFAGDAGARTAFTQSQLEAVDAWTPPGFAFEAALVVEADADEDFGDVEGVSGATPEAPADAAPDQDGASGQSSDGQGDSPDALPAFLQA